MAPVPKKATYEDLMAVPEHLVAEIIDGELVTSPRPAPPHARAEAAVTAHLFGGFDGPPSDRPDAPGGWWILAEPELHLGDDVLVPDLAGWRRARMPSMPDAVGFTLAPDWVCEIASPSTGRLDRSRKMPIYGRNGIPHLWIVDPLQRTLEVYRLEAGRWMVVANHGGDDRVRAEPFDAIELPLARWWLDTA